MTTDASGNVYFGSGFTGTFDFDPGPDNTLRTSNGNLDIYTTMFDSSGNFKWVQTAGSNSMDFTRAMTWSAFDNSIYITGQHSNQAFFDSSLNKIPSNGWDDIFIAKINQVYPLSVGSENIYYYSIYPNPSSGILNISVKNNIYSHEYIYVYNTIGAMVYQTVFGPLLEKTIDLTHLSRGIYFIRLSGLTKTIVIE
ncbi:MAG: T9SS type A sorting domain-containing protein [Bacteroidetes bacterium]|nr:T9SS type A sorting domain-containing protein [Bacteroidota bacterium]